MKLVKKELKNVNNLLYDEINECIKNVDKNGESFKSIVYSIFDINKIIREKQNYEIFDDYVKKDEYSLPLEHMLDKMISKIVPLNHVKAEVPNENGTTDLKDLLLSFAGKNNEKLIEKVKAKHNEDYLKDHIMTNLIIMSSPVFYETSRVIVDEYILEKFYVGFVDTKTREEHYEEFDGLSEVLDSSRTNSNYSKAFSRRMADGNDYELFTGNIYLSEDRKIFPTLNEKGVIEKSAMYYSTNACPKKYTHRHPKSFTIENPIEYYENEPKKFSMYSDSENKVQKIIKNIVYDVFKDVFGTDFTYHSEETDKTIASAVISILLSSYVYFGSIDRKLSMNRVRNLKDKLEDDNVRLPFLTQHFKITDTKLYKYAPITGSICAVNYVNRDGSNTTTFTSVLKRPRMENENNGKLDIQKATKEETQVESLENAQKESQVESEVEPLENVQNEAPQQTDSNEEFDFYDFVFGNDTQQSQNGTNQATKEMFANKADSENAIRNTAIDFVNNIHEGNMRTIVLNALKNKEDHIKRIMFNGRDNDTFEVEQDTDNNRVITLTPTENPRYFVNGLFNRNSLKNNETLIVDAGNYAIIERNVNILRMVPIDNQNGSSQESSPSESSPSESSPSESSQKLMASDFLDVVNETDIKVDVNNEVTVITTGNNTQIRVESAKKGQATLIVKKPN